MNPAMIYSETYEVTSALAPFNVPVELLQDVGYAAAAARNEASPLHPANAAGMYSYMAGVASLRSAFLQHPGWKMDRPKGAEAVVNEAQGIMILFQNVDFACGAHDPNPISGKGDGVADLVDDPSGYLFEDMAEEAKSGENTHVWFFCVSSNGDQVRAELSRPRSIKNGNFGTFAERIFILQDNDMPPVSTDDTHDQDFDVVISKKEA